MDWLLTAAGGATGYGLIGLLIALAIKAFRRDKPLPKWPIIACAIMGALSAVMTLAKISN